MRLSTRVGAAVAVAAMAIGLTALPSSALRPPLPVTVTGEATCNLATGNPTWTLTWTVTNPPVEVQNLDGNGVSGNPSETIDITSADQTGAWTGSVDDLVGETVMPGDSVMGTDGPVPNTTGTVTLTVDYEYFGGELMDQAVGSVELDGSCVLPTTTVDSTTTTAVAADAVAARPAFTG